MTFLASLLPGVREVRSALFAGYLWIAITYVGVQIWANGNEGTPFDILEARLSQTPQVWEFAVASVAAYFVGSISRAVFDPALLYLVDSTAKGIPKSRELVAASGEQGFNRAHTRKQRAVRRLRQLHIVFDPRISAGQRNALEKFLEEQWTPRLVVLNEIAIPRALWSPPNDLRERGDRVTRLFPDPVQQGIRNLGGFKLPTILGRAPHLALTEAVLNDIPVMRIRLLSSNAPQLFSEVDRHENEAELRTAVFMPLVVAGLVLYREYWTWGGLLLLLGAAIFCTQGLARRRQSRDLVIQALIAGAVESPLLSAAAAEFGDLSARVQRERTRQEREQRRIWEDEQRKQSPVTPASE